MKIKQAPDDFVVEELTDVAPSTGPFALYRLDKVGWTTNDALDVARRRWRIDTRRLSYGGLKDRHARTSQFLTILHGPRRNLAQQSFTVTYLGQVTSAYTSTSIRANRFGITIRALSDEQVESARRALAELAADGLANYFDDQRFSSVASSGDFVARQLILGNFEAALKLALMAPYEHDRSAAKREKATLRKHWGGWAECKQKLSRGQAQSVVGYLASQPTDFRGAFAHVRADLASLYMAAYQSHLWNRLLACWLQQSLPAEQRISMRLRLDDFPTPRGLSGGQRAELAGLTLPLPSARLHYADEIADAPANWSAVLRQVLEEEQIELSQMKLKGLRRPFFSRGDRPVMALPQDMGCSSEVDDRHEGRQMLQLGFVLPRGSYATLVVKRLVTSNEQL